MERNIKDLKYLKFLQRQKINEMKIVLTWILVFVLRLVTEKFYHGVLNGLFGFSVM